MADSWIDRANRRLNSEAFRVLLGRVKYENLPENQRELADVIGVEATLKLCEVLGGQNFAIPGNNWFTRIERNRRIREDFQSGMTAKEIGNLYRITRTHVNRILRASDAENMPKRIQRIVEIVGMDAARKLCDNIACRFYIPANNRLRAWLRNLEIHEAYYGQGRSAAEIAEDFRLSGRAVQSILNKRTEELNPGRKADNKRANKG